MFLRELTQSLSSIKGVGTASAARLAKLGIVNVADLLSRLPRDYDDRSQTISFAQALRHGRANTMATVLSHTWFGYGRMRTLKVRVEDESGEAVLVCFNRSFLEERLAVGERLRIVGKFELRYGDLQSTNFEAEPEGSPESQVPVMPIYSLTEGLSQAVIRKLVRRTFDEYGRMAEDELPETVRVQLKLMRKSEALEALHFPENPVHAESGRRTFAFEELFYLQLMVRQRAVARSQTRVERPLMEGRLRKALIERLPFSMTADQESTLGEIRADMHSAKPMARLLQGDVGSGKTLVAFMAALDAIESGGQAVLLAPTELLARQHADTAARLLEPLGVRLAFLSGNIDDGARKPLLQALSRGDIDLVLGTHALFSDDVSYKNLSLVIVDEQHRFGVLQRLAISRKGHDPDLLMMTATPIPRTLALTVYGDLSLSTIHNMPPGRLPITTHLARHGNEKKVYDFVRRELENGGQAYFVYPLIGESERLALKDAESMRDKLTNEIFPGIQVGLVHSRIKEEEKRATMSSFSRGEIRILVATSVVEVGVDVPGATCMVIEHADRFGLAALHQLRGRIGRGSRKSYCFLVYSDKLTEDGKRRLMALKDSNDGFLIAEEDLRIRGPGEISGTIQSGSLRLQAADLLRDLDLLEQARELVQKLLDKDKSLLLPENRVLAEVLKRAPPFRDTLGA